MQRFAITACAGVCAAMMLMASTTLAADAPPVFSTKSVPTLIADAKAAKNADKILVLKATAVWCGPCKQMDKTTWVDEKVVAWFKDHGTAAQFDVDKDTDLARQFNISAMPTMIALKNGEEVDRIVGYRSAEQLITWLDGLRAGKTSTDAAQDTLKKAKAGELDMQTRYQNANLLARAGKKKEALDEYLWLWDNMVKVEPSMYGVRRSFFVASMKELAEQHAPAKEAFTKLRDELEATLKTDKRTMDTLSDWVVLNDAVGDDDRTLAWFDRVKSDPSAKKSLDQESFRLQQLLVERNRLADLAILIQDPVREVRTCLELADMTRDRFPPGVDDAVKAEIREAEIRGLGTRVAPIYAAMLLAGRDAEAAKVMELVSAKDDTGRVRVMMVKAALDAGKANEAMKAALDSAKEKGASTDDARKRLDAALAAQKK